MQRGIEIAEASDPTLRDRVVWEFEDVEYDPAKAVRAFHYFRTERKVDLNLWCGKKYGGGHGANFGGTLASWACQKGGDTGTRHPIVKADVTAACKQQWYSVQDAMIVGTTWECLLNPQ